MTDRHAFFAGAFLLLLTLGMGVWQWTTLREFQSSTSTVQDELSILNENTETLTTRYQKIKADAASARQETLRALALVFPSSPDVTGLTRLLDDFAVKTNFETNPFFINTLKFGKVAELEKGLSYIPVEFSVQTSQKNLDKFLQMVEQSGSLEASTRLLSVEALSLAYDDEVTGLLTAQITLHAYFSSL